MEVPTRVEDNTIYETPRPPQIGPANRRRLLFVSVGEFARGMDHRVAAGTPSSGRCSPATTLPAYCRALLLAGRAAFPLLGGQGRADKNVGARTFLSAASQS